MFNIVKYRYLFLAISLIVIIPGLISLIAFGLNVGIDFAGGANVEIRPQRQLSDDQMLKLLQPFGLKGQQVILGTNAQLAASKTVWVQLNTEADGNVTTAVENAVNAKYPQASLNYDIVNITGSDGKPATLFTINGIPLANQTNVIKSALSKLPGTSSGSTVSSSSPTPTPTTTAKGSKPPTTSTSSGTTPVSVVDVQQGTTTQDITIQTLTQVSKSNSSDVTKGQVSLTQIQDSFLKNGGPYFYVVTNSQVGPSVASSTTEMAVLAVIAASICILLYVWFSFRKVPKALRYGVCAIIALLHDVLVVLGIFSILGKFTGVQIDSLFITGLLTVIGFSVHDTIVVFDRIRENMQRRTVENFEEVVNASLVQTMARSLNTSLTVLFTLLALTLFTGIGTDIHTFTLTLLIGIFSGTYSSIFNASMLLVIWEKGELGFKYLGGGEQPKLPAYRTQSAREMVRS